MSKFQNYYSFLLNKCQIDILNIIDSTVKKDIIFNGYRNNKHLNKYLFHFGLKVIVHGIYPLNFL